MKTKLKSIIAATLCVVGFVAGAKDVTISLSPWFDYLYLDPIENEISTNGWKLTGGKTCAAGTVLSLSATAPTVVKSRGDEWVFAGWYSADDSDYRLDNGTQDYRLASGYKFTTKDKDVTLYARFVPKSVEMNGVRIFFSPFRGKPGKAISPAIPMEFGSYTLPTVTVTGLPAGLTYDAANNQIVGTPTKSGVYQVTAMLTTVGGGKSSCSATFAVADDNERVVDVFFFPNHGQVTGAGVYSQGEQVTLKATAKSGYVFSGWYDETYMNLLSQEPNYSVMVGSKDVTLFADFINKSKDRVIIACDKFEIEGMEGVAIEPINLLVAESTSLPTMKITGLPAGLTYDTVKNQIVGTPTKSGSYTATATATTLGGSKSVITLKFIVKGANDRVVSVQCDSTKGKATGAGIYQKGKKATLKATANKGYVFSGWYINSDVLESQNPTFSFEVEDDDVMYEARFIAVEEDRVAIVFQRPEVECRTGAEIEPVGIGARGGSLPTIKVTGLPAGLKFTDKDIFNGTNKIVSANTIYGTPTKSGIYTVTATATTLGKATAKRTAKFIVKGENEWTLDVKCDATKGKVTGAGVYHAGKLVAMKATANKGYVFSGWYIDRELFVQDPNFYLVVYEENLMLEARFIAAEDDWATVTCSPAEIKCAPGDEIDLITVTAEGGSLPTVKVAGLPAGVAFKNGVISGKPTKSGVYTATVTATTLGKATATDTVKFIVKGENDSATMIEPWFDYCDLDPVKDRIPTDGVKLTGGSVCAAGTVLKLSATAPKAEKARGDEWVFAGWYSEQAYDSALHNGTQDWRLASGYKFTATEEDVTIFARFVPKSAEAQYVKVECFTLTDEYKTGEEISPAIPVETTSYTLSTVKVSGLPSGLKFNANDNTITGKPTKSGVYTATVTATTTGKATATTSVKFIVRNEGEQILDVEYDAAMGKVTGAGIYQPGKKAALNATANKGYIFTGWYENGKPLSKNASYSYTIEGTEDVLLVASFVSVEDDRASICADVGKLSFAKDCTTQAATVPCGVYLEWEVSGVALLEPSTVAVSGLPAGLKYDAKKSVICGVPTAASKVDKNGNATPSKVKITVTSAAKTKQEFVIELTVAALPDWAIGTFDGGLEGAEIEVAEGIKVSYTGVTTFTISKGGKITGKATTDKGTITFSAASFDSIDESGCYFVNLQASLSYNGKAVKVPFPVKLECSTLQDLGMILYNDDNDFAIKNPWKSWKLTFWTSKGGWAILDEDLFLFFDNNGVVKLSGSVVGDNGDPVSVSGSAQVLPIIWEWRDPYNCLIANVNVFVAPKKNLSNGFFKKYKVELVFNEMTLVGAHNITEN